jgi:hypothetical protein
VDDFGLYILEREVSDSESILPDELLARCFDRDVFERRYCMAGGKELGESLFRGENMEAADL